MKIKKIIWLTLGFIGLGLGAVGAVIPMLPAFPFLMLALFSFGKSSERLHKWFIGTKLYKPSWGRLRHTCRTGRTASC